MADTTTATTTRPRKRAAATRRKPAAKARAAASKTPARPATHAARAQELAERAVQVPIEAVLEARDRLTGTVTQLERRTRTARRGLERQRTQARKNLDLNVESLSTRVGPLKTGVEKVVQNGVGAGMKLVNGAQDRLSKVA